MFYKSNVCQKDHILQDLNILPSFLDRGVIWSSPKHKSLVQSISDGSQFLNCKHRLPISLLPQKVWKLKKRKSKRFKDRKVTLASSGVTGWHGNESCDTASTFSTVQITGNSQCSTLDGANTDWEEVFIKTHLLHIQLEFSALDAHLRHSSYCVSSPIWVLKVSCSTEFTNVVKNWKRSNHVLLAIAFKRSTLYDVIEVNETTLNQVFILPHVANFDLLPSTNK